MLCLIVLFQALFVLEWDWYHSLLHVAVILKLVRKHCFKATWTSIESGAICFMHLNLTTLPSTHTNLRVP